MVKDSKERFSVGKLADAIGVLVYVAPGLTLSVVIAAVVGYSSKALDWVEHPYVYVPAFVFLFVLWTYIGIMVLRSKGSVQTVKIAHEYSYSIIQDGHSIVFIKTLANHPTHPDTEGLAINLQFRNVSAGPVKVMVDDFRVVLDNRASGDPDTKHVIVLARISQKGVQCGIIPRDITKTNLTGTLAIRLLYGSPDGPYIRKYVLRMKIEVAINPAMSQAGMNGEILEETDEAYSS